MKNENHKKTIHVIAEYFYPVTAGMEVNMLETYKNLVKSGWDVIVHTTNSTYSENSALRTFERINGIKINRYGSKIYRYLPFIFKIKLNRGDIIALHGNDIFPFFYFYFYAIVSKLFRKKYFYLFFTPHGLYDQVTENGASLKVKAKKLIDFKFGSFLVNRAVDGVRAISAWEKNLLIRAGIKSSLIEVINNGLDEEAVKSTAGLPVFQKKARRQINQFGRYLIQVGRIDKNKNYETPIKALSYLPPDIKFLIVGGDHDKKYKRELFELIRKLGLEKRVLFLGVVKGMKKYFLMKNAQMMVHMSRTEGFCNAVHEGMSQGLVCIVANKTALPYLVKNNINGYCLDPDDYKGLAQKVNFVLKNKNSPKILAIKKRNKEFTIGHSWKNIAKEVGSFYLNTMEKQKRTEINYLRNKKLAEIQ